MADFAHSVLCRYRVLDPLPRFLLESNDGKRKSIKGGAQQGSRTCHQETRTCPIFKLIQLNLSPTHHLVEHANHFLPCKHGSGSYAGLHFRGKCQ